MGLDKLEFLDKGEFDLKKHRGVNSVILVFWSRYFEQEEETLELCSRLYSRYKEHKVAFLGVNLDSKSENVEKSVRKYKLDFTHTYNPYLTFPYKLLGAISQTGGSIVVIDKEGKIALLWQLINDQDFEDISKFLDQKLL